MSTRNPVRVRFAPSPTGHLHIGGLRSALFNWLFARHNNGAFVLRIEDTDKQRYKPEYTDAILESFEWMGMTSDEPIAIQSSFIEQHKELLQQLVTEGKAYKCYCSHELLEERLGTESPDKKYDRACRILDKDNAEPDAPYVIRFKLPEDRHEIVFNDIVRGTITIAMDQLDDFIIARSDGTPVYNFVVVVDDATMKINYVIRGEEHLGNTPKQILLYEALGLPMPQFAHIPLILSPEGGKLSKRDGAVSVVEYKKEGFLPDGLMNYLARLGWSHGDQEIFSRKELIELFTLEAVGKSGAVFDREKLLWVNGMHLKEMSAAAIDEYIQDNIDNDLSACRAQWSLEQWYELINLYKTRSQTVVQLIQAIAQLSDAPSTYSQDDVGKWLTQEGGEHLAAIQVQLASLNSWDAPAIQSSIKAYCAEKNIKLPIAAQPIRLALIGHTQSPSIFAIMALLGKSETLSRIDRLMKAV